MKTERIVVVGHGPLPDALLASARLIAGELPGVSALGLLPAESPSAYGERLAAELAGTDSVLVLSDLRGGTPDNVACVLARRRPSTWVVSNTSLPLLIECALGEVDLLDLAEVADLVRVSMSHQPEPSASPA